MPRLIPVLFLTLAACTPAEPPLLIDEGEPPRTADRAAEDAAAADADGQDS